MYVTSINYFVNAIAIASQFYMQPDKMTRVIFCINIITLSIFMLEVTSGLLAYRARYFEADKKWILFNSVFCVAFFYIIYLALTQNSLSQVVALICIFCLMRITRLTKIKRIRVIIRTIEEVMPAMATLFLLLIVFILIFTEVSIEFFALLNLNQNKTF